MAVKLSKYDVIRSPVFNEKAVSLSEIGKFVFVVAMSASKLAIKNAVESLFAVTVVDVNTHIRKRRVVRFRGIIGVQSSFKTAIVTLKPGESIEFEGNL